MCEAHEGCTSCHDTETVWLQVAPGLGCVYLEGCASCDNKYCVAMYETGALMAARVDPGDMPEKESVFSGVIASMLPGTTGTRKTLAAAVCWMCCHWDV